MTSVSSRKKTQNFKSVIFYFTQRHKANTKIAKGRSCDMISFAFKIPVKTSVAFQPGELQSFKRGAFYHKGRKDLSQSSQRRLKTLFAEKKHVTVHGDKSVFLRNAGKMRATPLRCNCKLPCREAFSFRESLIIPLASRELCSRTHKNTSRFDRQSRKKRMDRGAL